MIEPLLASAEISRELASSIEWVNNTREITSREDVPYKDAVFAAQNSIHALRTILQWYIQIGYNPENIKEMIKLELKEILTEKS